MNQYDEILDIIDSGSLQEKKDALLSMEELASKDNLSALRYLGENYLYGDEDVEYLQGDPFIQEDEVKAIDFLERAISLDSAGDAYILGYYFLHNKEPVDIQIARVYFLRAVDLGSYRAAYALMEIYEKEEDSENTKKYLREFLGLLESRAEKLDPEATAQLVEFNRTGHSVYPANHSEALKWLDFEVEKNIDTSETYEVLAWLYENGVGIDRSSQKSEESKTKAKEMGDDEDLSLYEDITDRFSEEGLMTRLEGLSEVERESYEYKVAPWYQCLHPLYGFYLPLAWQKEVLAPKIKEEYEKMTPINREHFLKYVQEILIDKTNMGQIDSVNWEQVKLALLGDNREG